MKKRGKGKGGVKIPELLGNRKEKEKHGYS